ncbi:unnamed protein product [Malus baccata var. baccata]
MQKQRGKWVEIPAGEFRASPEQYGNMIFSLHQLGEQWKKGLVIKGAEIRPKTKNGDPIDVAELLDVCRLEVYGKLDTAYLSPGTLYEVVLVVKLNAKEYGWEEPVEFTLETPAGDKNTRNVDLMQKQRGKWVEIPAGEFRASPEQYCKFILHCWSQAQIKEEGEGVR